MLVYTGVDWSIDIYRRIMDKKDLKILALKERIGELEDSNADFRVEITILTQQLEELSARIPEKDVNASAPQQEDVHNITAVE